MIQSNARSALTVVYVAAAVVTLVIVCGIAAAVWGLATGAY